MLMSEIIGFGYQTVKQLVLHNANVYLAARSPEKGRAALERLQHETGKEAHFLNLDLADIQSIRKSVVQFKRCVNMLLLSLGLKYNSQERALHLLFNSG